MAIPRQRVEKANSTYSSMVQRSVKLVGVTGFVLFVMIACMAHISMISLTVVLVVGKRLVKQINPLYDVPFEDEERVFTLNKFMKVIHNVAEHKVFKMAAHIR